MKREDIIRMARKVWSAGEVYVGPSEKTLEEFAALVAASAKAEEREECAKVCDELREWQTPKSCAVYIRARGQA